MRAQIRASLWRWGNHSWGGVIWHHWQREGQDSRRGGLRTPVKTIIGKTSCSWLVGSFSDKFSTRGSFARQVFALHDRYPFRTTSLRLAWQAARSHEHSPSPTKMQTVPHGATTARELFCYDAWGTSPPCHASALVGDTRGRPDLTWVLMQLCPTAQPSTRRHIRPCSTLTPPEAFECPLRRAHAYI
jgi:hypothetical protein